MPDITMCLSHDCPLAKDCFRHEAIPSEPVQSYARFEPFTTDAGTDCKQYWSISDIGRHYDSKPD